MALLRGKRIFMVEDDTRNSAIIRTILRQAGASVPYDQWGETSLNRMLDYSFDLDMILLDIMLPGKVSGYDVLAAIRDNEKLKALPVVAVSAADPDVEIRRAQELGFNSFISKPIDRRRFPQQLLDIMAGQAIWGAEGF